MAESLQRRLKRAGDTYRRTEEAHEQARAKLYDLVADALRDGMAPADIAALSTLTDRRIRQIRHEVGIEPRPVGKPGQGAR